MNRIFVTGMSVVGLVSALCVSACSSSSTTSDGDGGASSSSSSSGSSGASSTSSSSSSSSSSGSSGSPKSPFKDCSGGDAGSSGGSKCTQAETDAYVSCQLDKCDAEYKTALGADYKNGNFGGACKAYFDCYNACDCGDNTCLGKCAQSLTGDCAPALQAVSKCIQEKCPAPACAKE